MDFPKMEKQNKIILFIMGTTFILSFILGGLARNPVHIIMIRAFVSTALFGGIMLGARYVMKRYLHDVLAGEHRAGANSAGNAEEYLGRSVDYSVAEESEGSPGTV
jgi:hypothetical protein